jgi:general secretion pathway protein I
MIMRHQHGFTMLEAIVALVILSAALAGAWSWIATDLRALSSVRDLSLEEAAVQQAVAELEQIDLAAQPEGSLDWRDYRIEWRAAALEPTRGGRTSVGSAGLYQFTLYEVALEVAHRERLIAMPRIRMLQHERLPDVGESP